MSETSNASPTEKAAKIRRKPEQESALRPTFAAARQASSGDRPQPSGGGLLQRQCSCGKHTVAGGLCETCQKKQETASQRVPDEIGEAIAPDIQTRREGTSGFDFSGVPARTLTTSTGQPIQPNLMVNAPGDPYEQEADQVADTVMRLPATPLPPPLNGLDSFLNPTVSRLPSISRRLQASGGSGAFQAPSQVESRISQMQGSGQSLPDTERDFFETRMGYDFSNVRVHTDANAVQASREIQAQAFTTGNNIAFNEGAYQPGTESGRYLLAHELTHVVQQGAAGVQRQSRLGASQPSQVMRHLQMLQRQPEFDPGRYRQEIAQFQQQHAVPDILARQQQIMAAREPIDIVQRDSSRSIRRCSGGGSPGGGAAALSFSSESFTAGSGGALTATPSPSGTQLHIESAQYNPSGKVKVSGGTDAEAKDWEAGFIQTAKSVGFKAHYVGSAKEKTWSISLPSAKRDALVETGEPWYDPNNTNGTGRAAFKKTGSSVSVSLWDQPLMPPTWDTPDGKGKLSHTEGKLVFTAWMIARKKTAPNTIEFLNWQSWEVDNAVTVNYASKGLKTVDKVNGKTEMTGSGTGQGSDTPVLTGKIGNKSLKIEWS